MAKVIDNNINPNSVTKAREKEAVAIQQASILAAQQLQDEILITRRKAAELDTDVIWDDPEFSTTPLLPETTDVPFDPLAARRAQVEAILQALKRAQEEFLEDIKGIVNQFDDEYAQHRAQFIDTLERRVDEWLATAPAHVDKTEVLAIKALLTQMRATQPTKLDLDAVTDLATCFQACTDHVLNQVEATDESDASLLARLVNAGLMRPAEAREIASDRDAMYADFSEQMHSRSERQVETEREIIKPLTILDLPDSEKRLPRLTKSYQPIFVEDLAEHFSTTVSRKITEEVKQEVAAVLADAPSEASRESAFKRQPPAHYPRTIYPSESAADNNSLSSSSSISSSTPGMGNS